MLASPGHATDMLAYQIAILGLIIAFRSTVWQCSFSDGTRMQVIKLPAEARDRCQAAT